MAAEQVLDIEPLGRLGGDGREFLRGHSGVDFVVQRNDGPAVLLGPDPALKNHLRTRIAPLRGIGEWAQRASQQLCKHHANRPAPAE